MSDVTEDSVEEGAEDTVEPSVENSRPYETIRFTGALASCVGAWHGA